MDCATVAHDNLAERYLAGELPPGQQEAYERHFFECDACYGELEQLTAIRRALVEAKAGRPEVKRVRPAFAPGWRWPAVAALAASAIAAVVLVQQHEPTETATVATTTTPELMPGTATSADPATVTVAPSVATESVAHPPGDRSAGRESRPSRAQWLQRLARTDPPRYSPSVLRGAYDEASQLFREGMQHYTTGDYAATIPALQKAASADPARADIAFFLAASELMRGEHAAAEAGFEGVISLGESPFTQESRYYLAKIELAKGDVGAARVELGKVAAAGGPLAIEATQVLSELEASPVN